MTLHRPNPAADWQEVRIVCALPLGQFLVEETERAFNGRFVAARSDLREVVGILELREPWNNPPLALRGVAA